MMYKAINFENWLRNNYPEEEAHPEYGCLQCEGDGFIDVGKYYPDTCLLCGGTGSDRYSEYEELTAIEKEKWDKWNS